MINYLITAKEECVNCEFKKFIKGEKELKFPWVCTHEKREGKNPSIETKDNSETFDYVEGKKKRHCEFVYVKPVKAKRASKTIVPPVVEASVQNSEATAPETSGPETEVKA